MNDRTDLFMHGLIGSMILFILTLTFVLGWLVYSLATTTVYELPHGEWRCSTTRREEYTYYIEAGDVDIPQTGVRDVCVEYKRNY